MPSRIIVIGGDGLIGRGVVSRLRRTEIETICTTRQKENISRDRLYLDLADDPANWPSLPAAEAAVFCAGIVGFENCRSAPHKTWLVNVDRTILLAERLVSRSSRLVYLSSNAVFDGSHPHADIDTPCAPNTEYGRQKAAADRQFLSYGRQTAVLRLSKVLFPGLPMLAHWADRLKTGRTIEAASNIRRSPLPLDYVVTLILRLLEGPASGLFHASGDEDIPNDEFARMLARGMGADPGLVQSVQTANHEDLHPHTTMNSTRVATELSLPPPPSRATINSAVAAFVSKFPLTGNDRQVS